MSTPRPHQVWCSQSNVTMCNCRFPNGDDYIIGHHGPAPGPGKCVFCGKRCWPHTPCAKRLEASRAEGVAAPLEPTARDFAKQMVDFLVNYPSVFSMLDFFVERLEAYAAAVSKNAERERDAAVVTLWAMCGDEHWVTMGRNFAESLAKIEAREARILELESEITALREKP